MLCYFSKTREKVKKEKINTTWLTYRIISKKFLNKISHSLSQVTVRGYEYKQTISHTDEISRYVNRKHENVFKVLNKVCKKLLTTRIFTRWPK